MAASASSIVMHGARAAVAAGMLHIQEQVDGIERAVDEKPGLAFDLAKTLIESACKTILKERSVEFDPADDLPKLFRAVTNQLPFLPAAASGEVEARRSLVQTLNGLHTAVQGICELRNAFGYASHGKDAPRVEMEGIQALLVAQAADTIVGFLHRVHQQERIPPFNSGLEYEDNHAFNDYVDEAHGMVRIFTSEFKASEILYRLEPETYRVALAEYKAEPPGEEEAPADTKVREGTS